MAHRKSNPATYTHAFCLTKSVWVIIRDYAIKYELSYSAALRELVLKGYEKHKEDRRGGF